MENNNRIQNVEKPAQEMIRTGLLLCPFFAQEMDMSRNYYSIFKKGKFGRSYFRMKVR